MHMLYDRDYMCNHYIKKIQMSIFHALVNSSATFRHAHKDSNPYGDTDPKAQLRF